MAGTAFIRPRLSFFGSIHLSYLQLVVGLPLVCAILLAAAWRWAVPIERFTRLFLVAGLILAPIGFYASRIEPFWLRVDRVGVDSQAVDGSLRIGVLSDLQTPSIGDYERSAIAALIAEAPDLILLPGDVYQTNSGVVGAGDVGDFRELIADLVATAPVFVVEGDADNVQGLRALLEGTGATLLHDEVATVTVAAQDVTIVGVGMHVADPQQWVDTLELLDDAPDGALHIVLSHRPIVVESVTPGEVDLVVSGHTHGGQIALPFYGPPITLSRVPRDVAAGGLHQLNDTPVYVSTGVGRERGQAPQVRFLVRPSIGIIEVS